MTGNQKKILIAMVIACLVLLPLTGCVVFGNQTIYEDPEHVDFNGEDENDLEEEGTDVDSAEHAADDTDEAEHASEDADETGSEENETDAGGAEETFFEQDGVRLYYDPQLVLDVQPISETVPAVDVDEMYAPTNPAYVRFSLDMEQAQVYIAPVGEYETIADFAPGIIADLQRLIEGMETVDGCVPELPLGTFYHVCDHQQFTSNVKQVDFANGSGVRFVSVYSVQDMVPVDNEHLVYVFQGFTEDGKQFIRMTVRLLHAQLPDTGEIPAEIYGAADFATVKQYFADFGTTLNGSEADFSPKLDWIDTFLGSLKVE
jgi:hypothetical protein